MKAAMRILIGSGAAVNIDLGFEPNYVEVEMVDAATTTDRYFWCGRSQQEHATCITDSTEYGIIIKEGVTAVGDTTAKGISIYGGAKTQQVLVESPVPGKGLVKADVADWASGTSYASGERSATAIGTIVRPPTHNGYVYELTTDTAAGTSEPTAGWTTTPGETSTDGGANIWTCREENIVANKGVGITLGATLLESGAVFFVKAYMFDDVVDLGTPT